MNSEWPTPGQRSAVFSRGLQLSLCECGDISSAGLVFVGAHGFLDCAEFFAPLIMALHERRPDVAFVAMSFAGHGRSSWADSYGWYDHTTDLLTVIGAVGERMRAGATLGLVGHSFGAVQALQALTLEPGMADFAVNLDAVAPPFSLEPGGLPGALAQVADHGGDARPLPTYGDLDAVVRRRAASNPRLPVSLLRWLAPHLVREQDRRYVWRVDPALVGWVRPWDLTGSPPVDPLELTTALPHPVLTVTGAARDHPQVRGHYPGDAAIEALPGSRHFRLADAGHYVHLECPDQVADAILDHAAGAVGWRRS